MENKKDKAMVVVISGLTSNQAGQLTKEFTKAKEKYAPKARGTIAKGLMENVGNMIQGGYAKKSQKRVDYWLALYENSKCRNALRKIDMILEVMK